jgi:hypothetical protein
MFTVRSPLNQLFISGFVNIGVTFLDVVDDKTFKLSLFNTNGYSFDIQVTSKLSTFPLSIDILFLFIMPENAQYNTDYDIALLSSDEDVPLAEIEYEWSVNITYDYTMGGVKTRYVGSVATEMTMLVFGSAMCTNLTTVITDVITVINDTVTTIVNTTTVFVDRIIQADCTCTNKTIMVHVDREATWVLPLSSSVIMMIVAILLFVAGVCVWAWNAWVYSKSHTTYSHM